MELCGGTHVSNTSDIWYFKIVSEGAVASGIRRIEAITGDAVKDYFAEQDKTMDEVQSLLKNSKDPVKSISSLQEENSDLKKKVESLLKDKAKSLKSDLKNEIEEVNGINFLSKLVDLDAGGIKDLAFQLDIEMDNLFLVFGTEQNGKALLSCYISKNLVSEKDLNAGTIVRELGKYIQGGGGGQPFFATAGGKSPAGLNEALQKAKEYIK
jgi:alanyl-tRNA synthetase